MLPKSSQKFRASFARWIRPLSRWWIPIVFWGSIILGILGSTTSSWLIAKNWDIKGTPLGWLVEHPGITLPVASVLILLTLLAGLARRQTEQQTTPTSQQRRYWLRSRDQRSSRRDLLERVRATWITNVLEKSLHHAAWIDLCLQDRPDAVENPWRFIVQELGQMPRSLPTGVNIVELYDDAKGELLILGEPGAGKTTLLLQLARTLLGRAEADEREPLPVILLLSSGNWEKEHPSFSQWLVDQLKTKYRVPPQTALQWAENHQIVLLLDGLDEVAADVRRACVEAIIDYQQDPQSNSKTHLVLCCRSQEFEELAQPLPLSTAVSILPLSDEQVDAYLSSAPGQLDGLRHLLRIDSDFAELARRPLVLSIATLAFQGKRVVNFPSTDNFPSKNNFPVSTSHEQLLQTVFTTYITKMLSRRGKLPDWIQASFLSWLCFLARQLHREEQTIFTLEDLQPHWLPDAQQRLYWRSLRFLFMLFMGLISGLLGWLISGLPGGLLSGLVFGLFFGWALAAMREGKLHPAESTIWSWEKGLLEFLFDLFSELMVGLLLGSVMGLLLTFFIGPSAGESVGLLVGSLYGLLSWLNGVILHLALRYWLWRLNFLPWNLVSFLNEATERLLLLKVDGSYIFIHQLLLDYFAALDEQQITSLSQRS